MSRTIDNFISKQFPFDGSSNENTIGQQFEISEESKFVFYTDPILYI